MIAFKHMAVAVFALGALSACAGSYQVAEAPPPGSPSLQTGFLLGCANGHRDANTAYASLIADDQNSPRYKTDQDFRQGWDQGHALCYADEQRAPQSITGF